MGRDRRNGGGVAGRLAALLEAGDHGRARAEACRLALEPTTPEAGRQAAAEVLESLRPERGAQAVGVFGLLLAVAVLGWLLTR